MHCIKSPCNYADGQVATTFTLFFIFFKEFFVRNWLVRKQLQILTDNFRHSAFKKAIFFFWHFFHSFSRKKSVNQRIIRGTILRVTTFHHRPKRSNLRIFSSIESISWEEISESGIKSAVVRQFFVIDMSECARARIVVRFVKA